MPNFDTVRKVFEGVDRMSGPVDRIGKAFAGLAQAINNTDRESEGLERGFATLQQMMREVGNEATPTSANRFQYLAEAIDDVVTQDNVISLEEFDQKLEALTRDAGYSDVTLKNLQETGDEIIKTFFGAGVSAEKFKDKIHEIGDASGFSSALIKELDKTIDRTSDEGDIYRFTTLRNKIIEIGQAAGLTEPELMTMDREIKQVARDTLKMSAGMSTASLSALGLMGSAEGVSEEFEDMRREANAAARSLVGFDLNAGITAVVLNALALSADDAEGEFEELRKAIDDILPNDPITTLNLGPINISLRELGSTIVSLTAVLGPLIATVGGLTTAILALSGAAASFMGIGLLQFLDEIQMQFAGITTRAEALQATMKGLLEAVRIAFEPITEGTIAGKTPLEFFIGSVQTAMRFLRGFAEIMSRLSNLEEVASFFERVSTALFTSDQGITMMQALTRVIQEVLPIFTDFVVFFINNLPEFISFMTDITEQAGPALGDIFGALIPLFAELTRFGAELFDVIAKLTDVMEAIVGPIIDGFEALDEWLGPAIDLGDAVEKAVAGLIAFFIAFTVLNGVIGTATTLFALLEGLTTALGAVFILLGTNANVAALSIGGLTLSVEGLTAALEVLATGTLIGIVLLILGIVVYAFLHWGETIQFVDERMQELHETINAISESVHRLIGQLTHMGNIIPRLDLGIPGLSLPNMQVGRRAESSQLGGGNSYTIQVNGAGGDGESLGRTITKWIERHERRDSMRRTGSPA